MGVHDVYGKQLMRQVAGEAYTSIGPSIYLYFGEHGGSAGIDGTVGKDIAVEIESRTAKQVRGAVVDLIFHPFPKKLLVLLPLYMYNTTTTVAQCEYILGKFLKTEAFNVALLEGHGHDQKFDNDSAILRRALNELGFAK